MIKESVGMCGRLCWERRSGESAYYRGVPGERVPVRGAVLQGARLGHATLLDGMIVDGLWDAFHDVHMVRIERKLAGGV